MRAIFCGTPEIAVPSLRALAEIAEIVGVICQPDRPAGRGMKLTPPAVKTAALSLGLEVYQPIKVRDGALVSWMEERNADFALVIAYGRILPAAALRTPRLGCVNLHASLLPEYRGAAPIQRVLMDGRTETGVCLMQMDEGMDTGPVLARRAIPITAEETAGTLAERLGELAAQITREDLPRFLRGELEAQPQMHDLATHAPPIAKQDLVLDFERPCSHLIAHVRGLSPKPAALCFLDPQFAKRFQIQSAAMLDQSLHLEPGEVGQYRDLLVIGTKDRPLVVLQGQMAGKNAQTGAELLRGRSLIPGQRLFGMTKSQASVP